MSTTKIYVCIFTQNSYTFHNSYVYLIHVEDIAGYYIAKSYNKYHFAVHHIV